MGKAPHLFDGAIHHHFEKKGWYESRKW